MCVDPASCEALLVGYDAVMDVHGLGTQFVIAPYPLAKRACLRPSCPIVPLPHVQMQVAVEVYIVDTYRSPTWRFSK